MIYERAHHVSLGSSPRPCSPAMSEISVGSPSPPPPPLAACCTGTAFRAVDAKRLRLSPSPLALAVGPAAARRKSSAERLKSFSIADILGKRDEEATSPFATSTTAATASATTSTTTTTTTSDRVALPLPMPLSLPLPLPLPLPPPPVPPHALTMPTAALGKGGQSLPPHDWEALRGGPLPLRPFLPPALLHYEHQRIAWDYQRQLQEHFHVQAQLLRQMSLDPAIIPSEDGSERSRSSSGSECCSPDVVGMPDGGAEEHAGEVGKRVAEEDKRARVLGEHDKAQNSGTEEDSAKRSPGDTPLDALFQLSTKNFDEEQDPTTLSIFATRPNPKKKRKSRTAFTNHQIFELEKRFLYQKYLSPADRDEIAAGLGLSNAQVITWFQNRRAKLKRDMEELKKDVESVKQLPDQSADISPQQFQQYQLQLYHHYQQRQQHQQQQQQQQQQQHHTHHFPNQPPHQLPLSLTSTLVSASVATTTATATAGVATTTALPPPASAASAMPGVICSTAAEDKQDLKLLKMMTLMYYSRQSCNDAGSGLSLRAN